MECNALQIPSSKFVTKKSSAYQHKSGEKVRGFRPANGSPETRGPTGWKLRPAKVLARALAALRKGRK